MHYYSYYGKEKSKIFAGVYITIKHGKSKDRPKELFLSRRKMEESIFPLREESIFMYSIWKVPLNQKYITQHSAHFTQWVYQPDPVDIYTKYTGNEEVISAKSKKELIFKNWNRCLDNQKCLGKNLMTAHLKYHLKGKYLRFHIALNTSNQFFLRLLNCLF